MSKHTHHRPKQRLWAALTAGLVILVVAVALWLWKPGGDGVPEEVNEQLRLNRAALAATENLETEAAEQAWSPLLALAPGDQSVALNRALNRLLRVSELTDRVNNASLERAEQQAARAELPAAIEAAREAIDDYASVADNPVLTLWMRSRVDLQEASLLPGPMSRSLRREIFDRLTNAISGDIGTSPQSVILGGLLVQVLEELEDPVEGLSPQLLEQAAETAGRLSDRHEDNLYLALRAAQWNIAAQNPEAVRLVRRTRQLAEAIEPSLRRQTEPIGLTPEQLVEEITAAIERGDWAAAENRMLLWFNVLNSTQLVKTDRRRASPHPLDRLSFDSLRRLSALVAPSQPAKRGEAPIEFESAPIAKGANWRLARPVDFDVDLDPDIVALSDDGSIQLWRNETEDRWTEAGAIQLDGNPVGLVVADLFMVDSSDPQRLQVDRTARASGSEDGSAAARHTTFPTFVAYGPEGARLISVDGRLATADEDRLSLVEEPTGLENLQDVQAMVAGDFEGDGDLDLAAATRPGGIRIFVNRGNRTFFEAGGERNAADEPSPDQETAQGGFAQGTSIASMAIVDLDRDLDLDIVTVDSTSGTVGVLENLLHLQFRYRPLDEIEPLEGASQIAVAELDGNVSWDLVVAGEDSVSIVYSQTAEAGLWTVEETLRTGSPGSGLAVADFNNDSWMEMLRSQSDSANLYRIGPDGIGESNSVRASFQGSEIFVADFNADGQLDLVGVDQGQPTVAWNRTERLGHYMNVRFKGIDDNNANSGRVNHYAIGSILELRFGPHYRAKTITSPTTHFGLDGFESADSLRIIFPNGLTQTVRNPAVDTLVEEEQTLKGSCPYLYAWDGEQFAFVTDCLWAAPLGLQVARGVVAKDRPWEYLKVDGRFVEQDGDHYRFRITEELWEIAYVDHLSLQAVDHPVDVDIWTNEKVGPAEVATPTIHAFGPEDLHPIDRAVDTDGRDVTELLGEADRRFVQGFDRRLRQGLCPPHWIDLDVSRAAKALSDAENLNDTKVPSETETASDGEASLYLVLTGWILPTDTSLNIQIDQNPELPPVEFPSIWVPDAAEPTGWRKAVPYMGFPGGKTKTIVVDVTEVLNQEDPRLRIRTSAQIYWDSAEVAVQQSPAEIQVHDLQLDSAELAYHGYSKRIDPGPKRPETYDYEQAASSPRWPPLRGPLTRFGPCRPLLEKWDDQMVVLGSGDEIRFRFLAPKQPVPEGWERDFVLHCVGWDKDADLNTLSGQSSMPLPWRDMQVYPPTRAELAESQRVWQLNRDHLQRRQSFRAFWNRDGSAEEKRFLKAAGR